jgi:hypothetical protein
MTFASMTALAPAVLWRFSRAYRTPVCGIASLAAILLAIRALSARQFIWGFAFLGIRGGFTPFWSGHLSPALLTTFDMATLALFAISPVVLKRSSTVAVLWQADRSSTSPIDRS